MEKIEFIVSKADEGKRLDIYLTEKLDYSRSYIQGVLKDGNVFFNEKKGKANIKVSSGDTVKIFIEESKPIDLKGENIPLQILYEDHDMIIIDKPRGLVVHPAAGNYEGTLVHALLYHCKDLSGINGELRPGIVHRLDKDTSGVMMVAKNDLAHIGLAEQIKAHTAKRTYYALVHGNIAENTGTIKAPIGRHPKDRLKMAVVFKNSKEAITHFTVIERYGKFTLVECVLETGRTHQIRVHMAYIGHPILNDPLYGYKKDNFPITGQALHSRTLDVMHPVKNTLIHIETNLPQDFLDTIAYITKQS